MEGVENISTVYSDEVQLAETSAYTIMYMYMYSTAQIQGIINAFALFACIWAVL